MDWSKWENSYSIELPSVKKIKQEIDSEGKVSSLLKKINQEFHNPNL